MQIHLHEITKVLNARLFESSHVLDYVCMSLPCIDQVNSSMTILSYCSKLVMIRFSVT